MENKLKCPNCAGKQKSKTHCPGGLCDWLTCECGFKWCLTTGKGFRDPGPLQKKV